MNIEEMLENLPSDYPFAAIGTLARLMGTDGTQKTIDVIIADVQNDIPFDEVKQDNLIRAMQAYKNLKLLKK